MENNKFFRFLFEKKSNMPKKEISAAFRKLFPQAKNAEWNQKNNHYEVVFYENDIEKIAEFDLKGNSLSLKTNINPAKFKGDLRNVAEKYGEIMNTIEIVKGNVKQFEIIVRDKELTRFELILDVEGKEIAFEKL